MPSPRFLRPLLRPEARRPAAAFLLVVLLAASFACRSAPPPQSPPREPVGRAPQPLALDPADRPYLIDPLEGYARPVSPEVQDRVHNVWRDLLEEGDVEGALRIGSELLDADPELLPAQVLIAQVDFAGGDDRLVVQRLLPVGDALPGYTASQLLIGRAAERLGDIALAYSAYRSIARHPLAFKRAGELHPRALEIVSNRLAEALRIHDTAGAEKQLGFLKSWAPSETVTFEAARKVAQAQGDRRAELAAVKELSSRAPGDRALLESRAELELTVGNPSAGLKIVQDLAAKHPNDPGMSEKLDSAKFRWRLSQLPRDVQEVAAKDELNKGDLAVLLYWLVPDVRNSRPSAGRIANDVLDSPHREEIVRVINLGLMEVDPTLHRFSPGASVRRGYGLRVVLRALGRSGKGACGGSSSADTCDAAAACGLLRGGDPCDPGAPLSGIEGVEILRRSLKLLGGS